MTGVTCSMATADLATRAAGAGGRTVRPTARPGPAAWVAARRPRRRGVRPRGAVVLPPTSAPRSASSDRAARPRPRAIPLGVVIPTFLWLDRFEAEPTRYLARGLPLGRARRRARRGRLQHRRQHRLPGGHRPPTTRCSRPRSSRRPLVEEACKGLLVLLVWWFRRREFDGIIDGMVYAGRRRRRLRLHREHPVPRRWPTPRAAARR